MKGTTFRINWPKISDKGTLWLIFINLQRCGVIQINGWTARCFIWVVLDLNHKTFWNHFIKFVDHRHPNGKKCVGFMIETHCSSESTVRIHTEHGVVYFSSTSGKHVDKCPSLRIARIKFANHRSRWHVFHYLKRTDWNKILWRKIRFAEIGNENSERILHRCPMLVHRRYPYAQRLVRFIIKLGIRGQGPIRIHQKQAVVCVTQSAYQMIS